MNAENENTHELEGGIKYIGKLHQGVPQGFGKLIWANGDFYEGNVSSNLNKVLSSSNSAKGKAKEKE